MPESKKYKAAIALFDREQQYTPTEAVSIVKKTASKKFDESVDIAVRLGVDPRKADQAVRGTVALPQARARRSASPSSPPVTQPTTPAPPVQTWWARTTSPSRSRAG